MSLPTELTHAGSPDTVWYESTFQVEVQTDEDYALLKELGNTVVNQDPFRQEIKLPGGITVRGEKVLLVTGIHAQMPGSTHLAKIKATVTILVERPRT